MQTFFRCCVMQTLHFVLLLLLRPDGLLYEVVRCVCASVEHLELCNC